MSKVQIRQGDIFFQEVDGLPTNESLEVKKDNVIAYGEVTGHSHTIVDAPNDLKKYVNKDGDIYLHSPSSPIKVDHQEHDMIELANNKFFNVFRQREYDPLAAEKERQVAD